jgi:hypothetical protein
MPRRKKQLKEFVLYSITTREFARKGNKFITTEIESGRPLDLPKGYDNWRQGWSWQEIYETKINPLHRSAAKYINTDPNVCRIEKVISSKE